MEMIVLCFPEGAIKMWICEDEHEEPILESEVFYESFFEEIVYLQRIYNVTKIRLFGNKDYCLGIAQHLEKFIPMEELELDIIEEKFGALEHDEEEDKELEEAEEEETENDEELA